MTRAIEIIRHEHRALAAVLSALQAFVAGVAGGYYELDFELLRAMVRYITELPDQVHHPKEDRYLFVALRKRSPELAAVLDDLEDEHRNVHVKWTELASALTQLERTGGSGLPAFREVLNAYVDFQWRHMATEERDVLPLASEVLLPEDWAAIDAAFTANDSPLEGAAAKFRQLFARIATIAPVPIALADAAARDPRP